MKSVKKAMSALIDNSKKEESEKKSITIRLDFEEYAALKVLAGCTNKKPSALAKIIFSAALEDAEKCYVDACESNEEYILFSQKIVEKHVQLVVLQKQTTTAQPLPEIN